MNLTLDIAWPESLPLPRVDYTGETRNSTIMSPMDSAVIRSRSRFQKSYATVSVSWALSSTQFEDFKSFFLNDLDVGTSQFQIELRYPLNSSLTQWAVRFLEGYSAIYNDGTWQVSASLDLVSPVLLTSDLPGPPVTNGLVARWEADYVGLKLEDGEKTPLWVDQSGSYRIATQDDESLQPTYRTNVFGTAPALRFTNSKLNFTPSNLPSWTLLLAWQLRSYNNSIDAFGGIISWRRLGMAGFMFQDANGSFFGWKPNFYATNTADAVLITKYSFGDYVAPEKGIHVHRWNGATSAHAWRKNGSDSALYSLNAYSWPDIGAKIGQTYNYCNCDIGAILVYNRPLSDAEIVLDEAYLNAKYPCF